jgi:hypothetical protein
MREEQTQSVFKNSVLRKPLDPPPQKKKKFARENCMMIKFMFQASDSLCGVAEAFVLVGCCVVQHPKETEVSASCLCFLSCAIRVIISRKRWAWHIVRSGE